MRILDRYVLREMGAPFALGLFVFTFVVLTNALTRMLDLLLTKGVSGWTVGKLLLLSLPHLVVLTIPMSVLLAVLMAFGRLSSDSEITALKASGIPVRRLLRPVMLFALAAYVVTEVVFLYALPTSNTALQKLRFDILNTRANVGIKPRYFSSDFQDMMIYVQDMDASSREMRGLFIASGLDTGQPQIILARRGTKIPQPERERMILRLEDATVHEIPDRSQTRYSVTPGIEVYDLALDIAFLKRTQISKSERSMTVAELRQKIRDRLAEGRSADSARVEIHKKFSIPFACLVFGLIGVPLGITNRRGGRSSGLALAIAVFVFYYMFLASGEGLGDEGRLPPWLAMWLPNLVLGGIGVYLAARVSRETPAPWIERSLELARMLGRWIAGRLIGSSRRLDRQTARPARIRPRPLMAVRILDLYVGRSFLKIFAYVLVAMIGLSLLVNTFERLDDFSRYEAPLGLAVHAMLTRAPFFAFLAIHFAVLVATILTINLLVRTSEMVAMLATGVSFPRTVLPILALGLGISGFSFVLDEVVVPAANRRTEAIWDQIKNRQQTPFVYNHRWFRGKDDSLFYYQSYDSRRMVVSGFSLFRLDEQGNLVQRIEAPEMSWRPNLMAWVYRNARVVALAPDGRVVLDEIYETLRSDLREVPEDFSKEMQASDEMNLRQLRRYVEALEASGFDASSYRVDLHSKLSLPLLSVLMVLLGAPFAMQSGRSSGLVGVGLAILLGFAYFLVFKVFQEFGHAGRLPPAFAAWIANILCLVAGSYLLFRART